MDVILRLVIHGRQKPIFKAEEKKKKTSFFSLISPFFVDY